MVALERNNKQNLLLQGGVFVGGLLRDNQVSLPCARAKNGLLGDNQVSLPCASAQNGLLGDNQVSLPCASAKNGLLAYVLLSTVPRAKAS